MYKGILFDFDGVLARTMDDNFAAWRVVFAEYNVSLNARDFFPLEGMPVEEMARELCKIGNCDTALAREITAKKDEYYRANHLFSFYEGVEELVNTLSVKSIPLGIVSGGRLERLHATAPLQFLKKFNIIVTGAEAGRGKPHPDPYIAGAKALGLSPRECIAVENAPLGIQAAKAAGCYCIAIASTVEKNLLSEADIIVNDFQKLITLSSMTALLKSIERSTSIVQ